ncbi:hypothetical protein ACFW9V_14705 [Streptomyces hygroscopicus]|uniref:hypothetical protein n=1 Tax=Streptomyces hygroscopicus TaxID=1912 RepID=UPI0036C99969
MVTIFGGFQDGEASNEGQASEQPADVRDGGTDSAVPSEEKPQVRWSGELVAVYKEVDLDSTPPSRTWGGAGDMHASWGTPKGSTVSAYFTYGGEGVELDPKVKATPETCEERISTHGVDSLDVEVGTRFCVLTDSGRTALFDVKSVDIEAEDFTAQATIWEK